MKAITTTFLLLLLLVVIHSVPQVSYSQVQSDDDDESLGKIIYLENMDYDKTLDPYTYVATNTTNQRLTALLFSSLYRIDENSQLVPDMAERLDYDKAIKGTYIITLKTGMFWKNGEAVKAIDVCSTIQILKESRTQCNSSQLLQREIMKVKDCQALPNSQVKFRITFEPELKDTDQVKRLLMFPILPYRQGFDYLDRKSSFASRPIGSGPFYYNDKYGDQIVMLRNGRFHRKQSNPGLSPITKLIEQSADDEPRYAIFMGSGTDGNGGAQLMVDVPWSKVNDLLAQSERFTVKKLPPMNYYYLGLNFEREAFKNADLRKAISMALDRKYIMDNVYLTACDSITGPFPNASPYVDPKVTVDPYNTAEARKMLERSGFTDSNGDGIYEIDGKSLSFRLLYPRDKGSLYDTYATVCEIIQGSLKKIGIEIKLEHYPSDQWREMVYRKRDFDISYGKWSFGDISSSPDAMFTCSERSSKSLNYINYCNKDVDAMFNSFIKETDSEKRKDRGRAIHAKLASERPYIFLWTLKQISAYDRTRLINLNLNPYNYFDNIYDWGVKKQQ